MAWLDIGLVVDEVPCSEFSTSPGFPRRSWMRSHADAMACARRFQFDRGSLQATVWVFCKFGHHVPRPLRVARRNRHCGLLIFSYVLFLFFSFLFGPLAFLFPSRRVDPQGTQPLHSPCFGYSQEPSWLHKPKQLPATPPPLSWRSRSAAEQAAQLAMHKATLRAAPRQRSRPHLRQLAQAQHFAQESLQTVPHHRGFHVHSQEALLSGKHSRM